MIINIFRRRVIFRVAAKILVALALIHSDIVNLELAREHHVRDIDFLERLGNCQVQHNRLGKTLGLLNEQEPTHHWLLCNRPRRNLGHGIGSNSTRLHPKRLLAISEPGNEPLVTRIPVGVVLESKRLELALALLVNVLRQRGQPRDGLLAVQSMAVSPVLSERIRAIRTHQTLGSRSKR